MIEDIDRFFILSEEPVSYTYEEMSQRAWVRHCLIRFAYLNRAQVHDIDEIPSNIIQHWVNRRLDRFEERKFVDFSGERLCKFNLHSRPSSNTVFKIEGALPGTAETFFNGPDGSYLWRAMRGEDTKRVAIKRFLRRSGLEIDDLYKYDNEFFIDLSNLCPRLGIPALAAFISLAFLQHKELKINYTMNHLWFLEIGKYGHLAANDLLSATELDDLNFPDSLESLKKRPELDKAFALLHSHEVADALALYGIHNETLHTATGKLKPLPSHLTYSEGGKTYEIEIGKVFLKMDPFARYNNLAPILVKNTIQTPRTIWKHAIDKAPTDLRIPIGVLAKENWARHGNVYGSI